ncbi:MAG: DUF2934 domain-containing protein [Planctomycetota bacterium]
MSATASTRSKSAKAKPAAKKTRAKAAVKTKKSSKPASKKKVTPAKPVEVAAEVAQLGDPAVEAASAQPQTAPEVTEEQIGQRAYEIWLENGRPYGQEQANWDQAVAELRG